MSFMLAMLNAINNVQDTIGDQQLVDGKTTQILATMLVQPFLDYYRNLLNQWAGYVSADAAAGDSNDMTADSTAFQEIQTVANTSQGQLNNTTQTMATQTGQDSSNLQNMTGLLSSITQYLQMVAQMLNPM